MAFKLCILEEIETLQPDCDFIQKFENTVKQTIEKYNLIAPDDKVLVAVSGGKDSTVCLSVLKKIGYHIEAVTIDTHIGCYTKKNLENIKNFCQSHSIKLHVFTFRKEYGYSVCYIRDTLQEKGHNFSSCTVCGVLRRNILNRVVREVGATKVATGHNLDDEVETFLMNLFKNRQSLNARLGPSPGLIKDKLFVQRIKPLYFCKESDIEKYSKMMAFPVQYKRCPCSFNTMRSYIRELLEEFYKINPNGIVNLLNYLVSVLPNLRQKFASKSSSVPSRCSLCGEPCSGSVCRSCSIVNLIKDVS